MPDQAAQLHGPIEAHIPAQIALTLGQTQDWALAGCCGDVTVKRTTAGLIALIRRTEAEGHARLLRRCDLEIVVTNGQPGKAIEAVDIRHCLAHQLTIRAVEGDPDIGQPTFTPILHPIAIAIEPDKVTDLAGRRTRC